MAISLRENICRAGKLPRSDAVLMGRAELLKTEDHDLLEAVLILGQSTTSLARLMKTTPRDIRYRVGRLCRHLTSRRFLDAARALPYLDKETGELARLRFCQGASHRELCCRFNITWHRLRRRLDHLAAQIETIRRMTRVERHVQEE